ncbi:MAG: family 43 glycosylhydrolase [Chloroflexota bacterium]|nr:family 43 glycosylhydrolase [Chloroflexota bacterium]MDQ5865901.1 family 43 glycosylhydrolase [Chloroflexota bacterium]
MRTRSSIKLFGMLVLALAGVLGIALFQPGGAKADPAAPENHVPPGSYSNPLRIVVSGTGELVESWADPHVISATDGYYYAYATFDPLREGDFDVNGNLIFHTAPMARSSDLVHWTYIGDAFTSLPSYAEANTYIWAPDVRYFDGQYHMFYAVTNVKDATSGSTPGCGFDPAIGVATSPTPYGPWTHSAEPVVYPRHNGAGPGCNYFPTIDPAFVETETGARYIYYGSYYGGVWVRPLITGTLTTSQATEQMVAIDNKYEGAFIIKRNGFYYLFVSATDCCRGPLTGYSVFVGRSTSPLGPFLDKNGHSLDEDVSGGRAGGSVVLSMNGNKWVGPGHNSVISDTAGQDWFIYHAIDRSDPYFTRPETIDPDDPFNVNKRPMLMDRLDWYDGWPTVRAGYWASDSPQPAPIVVTGTTPSPTPAMRPMHATGALLEPQLDEFNGALEPQWGWVRPPATTTYSLTEHPGFFRFRTQNADLHQGNNSASVLTETAPSGDFMVEVKFEFNLPPSGCCHNYQQAGVVLYQDDDHYVKLTHVSIWNTRQTEWAKETGPNDPDRAHRSGHTYGNSVIGPPGAHTIPTTTTWLRIVREGNTNTGEQYYTGYSSIDGVNWERGATWTHNLSNLKIGLVSMGGSGHIADFDYVRVYSLAPAGSTETTTPTQTATATQTRTSTSTVLPSSTGTATAVATSTGTATRTATTMPSGTSTSTRTATSVATSTRTSTALPSATATACPIQFADVPADHTFYTFIRCLACRGIVSGYPCGGPGEECNANDDPYYRPGANVTRGQLSKIIANSAGLDDTPAEGQQQFADVPPGSPFYEFVERLAQTGAIAGYPCGGPGVTEPCDAEGRPYFRPNNPATRGQISKIVSIAAGFEEDVPSDRQTFTDVDQDSPFWVYIERLAGRGIISGYGEASRCPETGAPCFRYNENTTRGQMAKIAANAFFPNCQTPARR